MASSSPRQGGKIVLLGDSVLDNGVYVKGEGRSVTQWLRAKAGPLGYDVVNCAVDGDVMAGIPAQLQALPTDVTHVVLSIGGNDALHELSTTLSTHGRNPLAIIKAARRFEASLQRDYRTTLDLIDTKLTQGRGAESMDTRPKVMVLTLYRPRFDDVAMWALCSYGVSLANRAVKKVAGGYGYPIIDLARVFDEARDYANPIEPSVYGGDKISTNIVHVIQHHDWGSAASKLYAVKTYSTAEEVSVYEKTEEEDSGSSRRSVGYRDTRENDRFRT